MMLITGALGLTAILFGLYAVVFIIAVIHKLITGKPM